MSSSFNEFKEYFKKNIKDELKTTNKEENNKVINEFKKEYPIGKIKKMKLDEYVYKGKSGNTFCSKLVNYYQKYEVGPSILNGSINEKFGIHYLNNKYVDYTAKKKVIKKPEEYFSILKSQLVEVLINISKGIQDIDYEKYDHLYGMWNVILKLAYYYKPENNITFGGGDLVSVCNSFGIKNVYKKDNALNYSYRLKKYIDSNIPGAQSIDSANIGSLLWEYYVTHMGGPIKNGKNKNKVDNKKNSEIVLEERELSKNLIYYGVPGCGKSFKVNQYIEEHNFKKENVIRTVFHPDYTYTDFIGQVIPFSRYENNHTIIDYKTVLGPFTRALKIAKKSQNEKVCLIIEEINRGNAAAIFGDIFQILDRDSNYEIENEFISININNKKGDYNISLPPNMIILATMNTSDQNVYTLDTAFRRRFSFERIKNDFGENEDDPKVKLLRYKIIDGMDIKWNDFFKNVNEYIMIENELLLNNEDKRLGAFSVSVDDLDNRQKFADKVLFYLWDNIGKYNPGKLFREKNDRDVYYKVYDNVIDDFIAGEGINIFCDELKEKLSKVVIEKKENENEK